MSPGDLRLSRRTLAALATAGGLLLAAVLAPASACAAAPMGSDLRPAITRAAEAIVRQDAGAEEQMRALREAGKDRRTEMLKEIAAFLSDSNSTEQSMAGALILNRLEFTADEKIDVALAGLPTAAPPLRRVLTDLLSTVDRPEGAEPDFAVYESRLRKPGPPPALIRYLYDVSPEAAVGIMERVFGAGAAGGSGEKVQIVTRILSRAGAGAAPTERDLAEARRALEALAADEAAWWRRLYVAALLSREPALATPQLTSRLRHDADPRVREALAP